MKNNSVFKQTMNFSKKLENLEEKFLSDLSYLEDLKLNYYLLDQDGITKFNLSLKYRLP